ncbi:MAG: T9SS type A sorting domain-containing protein [Caldithrix sp.]|nr:T9SS type A sorting domain-containing protein [Caldithrix sp.]
MRQPSRIHQIYLSRLMIGLVAVSLLIITIWPVFRDQPDTTDKRSQLRPSEWFYVQRTFPYGRADADAYRRAVQQVHAQKRLLRPTSERAWQFAGPTNIGGRVVDIAFNPQNPNIVYAAAATGGVFKSEDSGESWYPVFDDQAVLTIGDIAIDPINPQTIYVGTGEANGGHNNFPGGGIYKSNDGGVNWQFIGLGQSASIGRIWVHPTNNDLVYVAAVGSYFAPNAQRGVYLSTDGGQNWRQILFVSDSTGAIDLVIDRHDPQFMLAAMWERVRRPVDVSKTHLYGPTSGIYRTYDGGDTWERLGPEHGLPDSQNERIGRIGLSMHRDDGQIIYALYTDGSDIRGLYRTKTGGDQWNRVDPQNALQTGDLGFSWYFGQVRVHPVDPDRVFVMDVALMRTTDAGETWPIRYGYSGYEGLHVDHHALAFHPQNPDYIINGNDGGINISTDGGVNWTKVGALPVTQFYEIGLDRSNPERLYGGTQDNGTLRTRNGFADDWEQILGADGFYAIVHPRDPQVIFAETQFGALHKSLDGGASFNNTITSRMSDERSNWSTPVVIDPNHPDTMYYGTFRLWRSENQGESWQVISPNLTRNLENSMVGTITTIAVAPSDERVVYAGTDDGLVWVTRDYGGNWQNITGELPFRWITRLAVHPRHADTAYVTLSGLKWKDAHPHVFKTIDGGGQWFAVSDGLPDAPVNALAIDPIQPDRIYIGTDVGVFVSFDGGGSWEILGTGLPVVVVNDLKIHPVSRELVAGTHGRSMYSFDLHALTALQEYENKAAIPAEITLLSSYPNPFNNYVTVMLKVNQSMHVSLRIYNAMGQVVNQLFSGEMEKGGQRVRWDATNQFGVPVSSGIYFYRIEAIDHPGLSKTGKLVLIK